jgi:hypothetical protein
MNSVMRLKYDNYSTIRAFVRSQWLKIFKDESRILGISGLGMLIKHEEVPAQILPARKNADYGQAPSRKVLLAIKQQSDYQPGLRLVVQKETFWPSLRVRRPARSTAEIWTKTSLLPLSG